MIDVDVLVVGGGPAGASCAWALRRAGVRCLVLDKARFPRLKLCAGWITPEVVADLEMDVTAYPHRFLTFHGIRIHLPFLSLTSRTVQHSIRRFEFDDWLLKRSGAGVEVHDVKRIHREGEHYVVDDAFRCRYLVGAGGTRCPVYRSLFRDDAPRMKELQAVTLEEEFPYAYGDEACQLWFFEKGLPGYAWYVPKADGYVNVGVGGMAAGLRRRGDDIKPHWTRFSEKLVSKGLVSARQFAPGGYSYFVRGPAPRGRVGNAFVVGDAAGLATRDLCEGIGPAVRSGLMAARSVTRGAAYELEVLARYSSSSRLMARFLDYGFHASGFRRH